MPSLAPFSGQWTDTQARHLLKRASFGITQSHVESAVSLGLSETINQLFTVKPLPLPPLKYLPDGTGNGEINDPGANFGETWVNAPAIPDAPTNTEKNKILRYRRQSLYAWSFLQMQNSGLSIREKLTLFWHNHFVASNNNPHRVYAYQNVLRNNALGNFKELVKLITIDTNMLLYLSGSINTDAAPNENYSRELLELFTIGKGPAVGNGDYTHYTEDDVVAMAKILTGWRVKGLSQEDTLISYFANSKHSKGSKTLSHRFGNAVIEENGENEYKDLIDVIFEQEECSKFITRKLYKWFVNSEITSEIETNIILPLAQIIRENNYDIAPALKTLLSSEHFYQITFCMIKNPIDLVFSATNSLMVKIPEQLITVSYEFAYNLFIVTSAIDQSIFNHPDVAGWKAYYQEPLFYKTWVNSYTLPNRLDFCRTVVTGGEIVVEGKKYNIPAYVPVLQIAESIPESKKPFVLIENLAKQLFNYEINQEQKNALLDILIPGLPDFEWTIEYSNYLANPADTALKNSVENKLKNLISTMVQMSEFQIM